MQTVTVSPEYRTECKREEDLMMNLVESSGGLADFADEVDAKHFMKPLSYPATLIVSAITLYEAFKVIC